MLLSTVHQYTLHVLSTISSLHPRCVLLGVLHAVHGAHTPHALCTHTTNSAHHDTISIHVVWCPWCGDVLCMLTHCPCCAAHITTYACTCNIMLQRPSPMAGAVVLLCGTRSTHSCYTYTPHAPCTHTTNTPCCCPHGHSHVAPQHTVWYLCAYAAPTYVLLIACYTNMCCVPTSL